ncbi:hypothetical protein VTO42DRAFT_7594 [Malbranchea cinnamomea]
MTSFPLFAAVTATTSTTASASWPSATNGTADWPPSYQDQARGQQRDLLTQIVLSVALGASAFLTFCILRPKWRTLYAARRRLRSAASRLPELPDSLFGWIPVLYRISDEEVLASAGLDAYVFLSFYTYAIKFFSFAFFFAVVIILPIHYTYTGRYGYPWDPKPGDGKKTETKTDPTYLWMYVVFTYVFTGLALHLLIQQTDKIIRRRQEYLGGQTSLTDRTIRLSGIPPELRSEEKIKDFVENLEIGKVDNVMLCRDWSELDDLMHSRKDALHRLEEAWTKYLGYRYKKSDGQTLPLVSTAPRGTRSGTSTGLGEDDERTRLLSQEEAAQAHVIEDGNHRPTIRLWYGPGPFKLRYKTVDAIDYYEEKLRQLDQKILAARAKEYPPMPLAFVTMESIAACQMAVQAILDPSPMQLVVSLAPTPSGVVWRHTYLSRKQRMIRGWSITLLIGLLTIFWSLLLVPLAYLLNLETIEKVIPRLADLLAEHPLAKSLVQTSLPTITLSLLSITVPFLYSWLANMQGMTSQSDVELSLISKNFFFTFFNLFLVFTIFATASNFYGLWENLRDVFKDTTIIAYALARSLERLAPFYGNFIVLQGLGLFPFRLLEFGSVFLYPFQRLGARTPRDYADLNTPPTFRYGFALPQSILIFIICIVYSVLPSSWLVTFFGLIYFFIGRFIYKYQLLYAMDHTQHSTGRAWPMICARIIVGLLVFQLAMIGILALRTAITRSTLIVPLFGFTIWFSYFFSRTYEPLMKFIALRSIDRYRPQETEESPTPMSMSMSGSMTLPAPMTSRSPPPPSGWDRDAIPLRLRGRDLAHRLRRYVNPNLVIPLDGAWIPGQRPQRDLAGFVFDDGRNGGGAASTNNGGNHNNTIGFEGAGILLPR